MAMWLFAKAISRGEPIKVFNHGDMQRDFTYIDDITAGVTASMEKEDMPDYSIINLGNNNPEQLMELIEVIEEAMGKKATKDLQPMQPGDVKATYAEIGLAAELLDFVPSTSMREGVPKFIEWFKKHPDLTGA